MVQLDFDGSKERDLSIDLESGTTADVEMPDRVWNGFATSNRANQNEEDVRSGTSYSNFEGPIENGEEASPLVKNVENPKPKKKSCKKPPKPPRPPSMDAADQKLVREISELAMLKRARVERMKALKRMKNAKSTSSNSSLVALIITIIFCFVIIWQGIFSRGRSSLNFQGSPESSAKARSGFISVQFYKNVSSSASPNNVELVSGLDDHGQASRGSG